MDFPPKIEIFVENVPKFVSSDPLCLCVEGLNEEVIFKLKPGKTYVTLSQHLTRCQRTTN